MRELENTSVNKLYTALINGNLDLVKEILDTGLDINCKVTNDWTPLFLTASQVSVHIVEELLKRGADAKTNRGSCPTQTYDNILMLFCNVLRWIHCCYGGV